MIGEKFTIYAIRCVNNKKMYIGRTKQILEERIKAHLTLLRSGKHSNKDMQEDYKKYGEDNFEFYELETDVEYKDKAKEKFYMDMYKTYNNEFGYNTKDSYYKAKGEIKIIKGLPNKTQLDTK